MAAFVGNSKANCHVRSISLPSRSHPLTVSVEEQLHRLRSLPAKSSPICHKLSGLKALYECVDELLQLTLTQQTLSHEQHKKWVEEVLDGSILLLDVCGNTRDVFSQKKESLQELESSLRRRRGGQSSLTSEVEAYVVSRKNLNKPISKCFRNLKSVEKICTSPMLDNDSKAVAVVRMLREVEEISVVVFESLLSFISQKKARSRPSGWSIISKLMKSKHVSCEGEVDANEVEKMDAELLLLNSSKGINLIQMQNVLKGLEALEFSIQEVEEELECVYRQLVKTRVFILNIFNH